MHDIKIKIEKLKLLLRTWEHEYYVKNSPSVDDAEYDLTLRTLVELEAEYPQFLTSDSPSQRVGGQPIDKFLKVKHSTPMLSLSNAFNNEDLLKFDNNVKKILKTEKEIQYFLEPKIDGLSISLIYVGGSLYKAVTRGDGVWGDDVTNNIKTIKTIPLSLNQKIDLEVRGEVYLTKTTLEKINSEIKDDDKKFSNCRNAASGAIHNLNPNETRKRNLTMQVYSVIDHNKLLIKTQSDAIKFLKENNFKVCNESILCNSINEVINKIEFFNNIKNSLNYPIDGLVVKINDFSSYNNIGYTSKFPKWAIAYKFSATIVTTKLLDVFPTVGRTGKITYVAKLEPVSLDGSTISFSTLHNAEYIKAKDIRINDIVKIFKAGEIIPKVIEPVLSKRPTDAKEYIPITHCPSCHTILEKNEGEIDQYCININCPSRIVLSIVHFASRDAMNIKGLSEKIIQKLYDYNFIKNISDLFLLHTKKEEIFNANILLKNKALNNLFNSIEESKNNSFDKLLYGLGIRHVGEISAKAICNHFNSIESLINASLEQLLEVEDVGDTVAQSIYDYFKNEENLKLIQDLISFGCKLKVEINKSADINSPYYKKTFVITGSLDAPRNIIKDKIKTLYDGKVVNSVTVKTDYLIASNDTDSTKYKQAEKLGVKILKEKIW